MQDDINRRLQVLEEMFEYQDQTIDDLNDVIIEQQNQINSLENQFLRLQELLTALQDSAPAGEDSPPPHY